MYRSSKIIEGFSTCFRQWRAKETHCSKLHGYAISFKVVFEAENLDHRNWVQDFGFMSRSKAEIDGKNLKDWFKYMFDHTTIIAADDPHLNHFIKLDDEGVLSLRVLDRTGCECFAELIYANLNRVVKSESGGRVRVYSVECIENMKNSAIFY
jgi:6-pyruvoyltetrahydropterin/6-carboxytetrahydropterin synthase